MATRVLPTRYDPSRPRKAVRRGREKGCWIFIPAAELEKAGVDPNADPPRYRLWGRRAGSVMVRLYRD